MAKLWKENAPQGSDVSEADDSSSLRSVLTRREPLQVECALQALRHTARSRDERMEVLSGLDSELSVLVPLFSSDDDPDLDG